MTEKIEIPVIVKKAKKEIDSHALHVISVTPLECDEPRPPIPGCGCPYCKPKEWPPNIFDLLDKYLKALLGLED